MTITALERFPDASELAAAMRTGYERIRPWPAADTELLANLVAARHLSVLNLGYNLTRPNYDAFVAQHTIWLREWMAN